MAPVIRVESISKRYRLRHAETVGRYRSLREDMATWPRRLLSRLQGRRPESVEDFWALDDVSFTVEPGEVLGLIGRNGAGKSTLLKILTRITSPTRGEARLRGRIASLLEVGTGFHPELTGRENIFLNGAILGMPRAEILSRFDEIVEFADIERFLDTPVKRYSSGMFVRLAFSVAAHLEADVLLIDEVLAVGDASFQKKCLGRMSGVASSGQTILFVSHNMGAIAGITSRCLLLERGRLVSDGPTSGVISRYLEELVPAGTLSRDLSDAARAGHCGQRWRFTAVRMPTNERPPTTLDDLVFEIDFTSHENLEDILLGIGLCNLDGAKVANVLSSEGRFLLKCAAGESGTLSVRVNQPRLSPGRYLVQLGAVSGVAVTLDLVTDALHFEISREAASHPWLNDHTNCGVLPAVEWRVKAP